MHCIVELYVLKMSACYFIFFSLQFHTAGPSLQQKSNKHKTEENPNPGQIQTHLSQKKTNAFSPPVPAWLDLTPILGSSIMWEYLVPGTFYYPVHQTSSHKLASRWCHSMSDESNSFTEIKTAIFETW